jgi:hypothetical protein
MCWVWRKKFRALVLVILALVFGPFSGKDGYVVYELLYLAFNIKKQIV